MNQNIHGLVENTDTMNQEIQSILTDHAMKNLYRNTILGRIETILEQFVRFGYGECIEVFV